MELAAAQNAHASAQPEMIGRVAAVTGAQATVKLNTRAGDATIGKFMGLMTPKSVLSRGFR